MNNCAVAAVQMQISGWNRTANTTLADALVREAANLGAQVVLLPELFELPYFCTEQDAAHFQYAEPFENNTTLAHFSRLAAELEVVLPISFFERAGPVCYNTVAMIDADGQILGRYRKTHIPDGPGYCEKFYFAPGNTGYQVWPTRYGAIGVGICWDQWFPECARSMALMGAQLLLYPTAIGSEPQNAKLDSSKHWQRVMQGHAAANVMPVIAANRVGTEQGRDFQQTYYGSSFIAGATGEMLAEADRAEEKILLQSFDLAAIDQQRLCWGVFRDRRPHTYAGLVG